MKQNGYLSEELLKCIKHWDVQGVKKLLEQGVSPTRNTRFFYPLESPLVLAVKMQHIEIVTLLLDYGAPIDEFELGKRRKITGLRIACWQHNIEMIQLLLHRGADPNLHIKQSLSPSEKLLEYIRILDIQEVKKLLEQGVSPCRKVSFFKSHQSPLVSATRMKSIELVTLLLDYGAPIDEFEFGRRYKSTALRRACYNYDVEMIQLLIERGADINLHTKHMGRSNLHLAVQTGDKSLVKMLLDKGALPSSVFNNTHWYKVSFEMMTILIEASNDIPEEILSSWEKEKKWIEEHNKRSTDTES